MHLSDVAEKPADFTLPPRVIAADRTLARDVQGALVLTGLLDPPVDGDFGPVSGWALAAFAAAHGVDADGALTPAVAHLLLEAGGRGVPALDLSAGDFAARAAAAMERRGYWFSRHPDCLTIFYIEGADIRGNANADEPNRFNDCRALLRVDARGKPSIVNSWEGTTEPGRYWTEHPMDPRGAARIVFGQYKAWVVGQHHAGRADAHEALVQAEDISVFRDLNRDGSRAGDTRYTGLFAINQHWGYDLPRGDLGRSSAGCLVGRSRDGHRAFMAAIKRDPRYQVNRSYRFMTAVMPASALTESRFDPATTH